MKYYGWFGRDNKFHLTKENPTEDDMMLALFIKEVEAENEFEARILCKQEIKERFKNLERIK